MSKIIHKRRRSSEACVRFLSFPCPDAGFPTSGYEPRKLDVLPVHFRARSDLDWENFAEEIFTPVGSVFLESKIQKSLAKIGSQPWKTDSIRLDHALTKGTIQNPGSNIPLRYPGRSKKVQQPEEANLRTLGQLGAKILLASRGGTSGPLFAQPLPS